MNFKFSFKRQSKNSNLDNLYIKYNRFTMIEKELFKDNLKLISGHFNNQFSNHVVVECGVWRGGMIAAVAELIGNEGQYFLFDSFEGLPNAEKIDGIAAIKWQSDIHSPLYFNNCTAEKQYAIEAMRMSGVNNFEIHEGWFENTIPNFCKKINDISILRLDGDWYSSTMICLEHLFPLVKNNGLIIIDDYFAWDGCSKAVHDYLSKIGSSSRIRTTNFLTYIIKNEEGRSI